MIFALGRWSGKIWKQKQEKWNSYGNIGKTYFPTWIIHQSAISSSLSVRRWTSSRQMVASRPIINFYFGLDVYCTLVDTTVSPPSNHIIMRNFLLCQFFMNNNNNNNYNKSNASVENPTPSEKIGRLHRLTNTKCLLIHSTALVSMSSYLPFSICGCKHFVFNLPRHISMVMPHKHFIVFSCA